MYLNSNLACVKIDYNGKSLYCVYEMATDQVVNHFKSEREAQKYIEFLEDGGAFAGFTPAFIMREFGKVDIDQQFSRHFG